MGLNKLGLIYNECYICNNEYAIVRDENSYIIYNKQLKILDYRFNSLIYCNIISILSNENNFYLVDSKGHIIELGNNRYNLLQQLELALNKEVINNMISKKHLYKNNGLIDIHLEYSSTKKYINIDVLKVSDGINTVLCVSKYNNNSNTFEIRPLDMYDYRYTKDFIQVLANRDSIIINVYDTLIKNVEHIARGIESEEVKILQYKQYGIKYLIGINKLLKEYNIVRITDGSKIITPNNFNEAYMIGYFVQATRETYNNNKVYSIYGLNGLYKIFDKVILINDNKKHNGILEIGVLGSNNSETGIDIIRYSLETLQRV